MSTLKIAVLSDIHGNATAYATAIQKAEAFAPDVVVMLGDLLTYGVRPRQVLELTDQLMARQNCVFIRGNHDQFYFDLDKGNPSFYDNIAGFVLESVEWTHGEVRGGPLLADRYPWADRYSMGPILFSHANPYDYGDWSYVSKPDQWAPAAAALRQMGKTVGVFGHSHRAFAVMIDEAGRPTPADQRKWIRIPKGSVLLLNPGAVGQGRGTGLSYLTLELDGDQVRIDIPSISFDLEQIRADIQATDLSQGTKERLISFMEK
ncbi:metallophosphoesterase family protein [Ruegeria arenilitoris]|uniref:metallophosphoesterase family protein n=1 Tax=Ruegeria arenilitoris TaxID=1173585 RepID=UPI001479CB01|nr:metallophosphoesterase [Ruegeria arenilitoris]